MLKTPTMSGFLEMQGLPTNAHSVATRSTGCTFSERTLGCAGPAGKAFLDGCWWQPCNEIAVNKWLEKRVWKYFHTLCNTPQTSFNGTCSKRVVSKHHQQMLPKCANVVDISP
jgi:hypothetical protein